MTTTTSLPAKAMDLTKRAPRSLRCRLGGYALLPRLLDKCRASIAGTIGDYHSNCPLDRQFFDFVDVDAFALRDELAKGRTDSEMLTWIQSNARKPRTPWEVESWSAHQENRGPTSDPDTTAFFAGVLKSVGPGRTDIRSWADLLDLDDHCSFGGSY